MKRQLDVRFLLVLLLVTAVFAGGAYALHGYQVRRNAGYLDTRAMEAEQKDDVPGALGYLSRYLSVRPDDAAARGRFGKLLAKVARSDREKEQALLTLERALREDPEQPEVRKAAAELAIDILRYPEAIEHLKTLLAARTKDAALATQLAKCYEATKKLPEAVQLYREVTEYDPGHVEAYTRQAAVLRRMDKPKEADDVMTKLVTANPNSYRARLALVGYHREQGRVTDAKAELAKLRGGADADKKEVLLAAAEAAQADRDAKAAAAVYREGIAKYPDEPLFPLGLADLTLREGDRAGAVALLRKAAGALPTKSPYLWGVTDLMITADEAKEAEQLVGRLQTELGEGAPVKYLKARLHLGKGQTRRAEQLLLDCRREFANNPELGSMTELLLAACYERQGKPDLRLQACKEAVRMSRASVPAQRAHADALLAKGEVDEAVREYQQLLQRAPEVRLVLARIGIVRQARKPAAEARVWTDVTKLLDEAPKALKDDPRHVQVRAELLHAQGRPQDALLLIEAERDKKPGEVSYWLALAFAAARNGTPKDGLAVLDKAAGQVGDSVTLRLARAELLSGAAPDAPGLRALEAGAEKFSDAERSQLHRGLAEAHLRAKSTADAERLLRNLATQQPDDPAILGRLFDVLAVKQDAAGIEDVVAKLRHQDAEGEDGAFWRFAEAYLYWLKNSQQLSPDDARHVHTRLAEAAQRRPQWYRVPLLEAEIADKRGQVDLAIEKYRQAVRLGVRDADVVRRAAGLLLTRRRHDDVRQLLEEVRGAAPTGSEKLAVIETALALAQGADAKTTLELADRTAPASSTDHRDHLYRGQVFWSVGQLKEAEAAFRKAVELAPAAPDARVGLVIFLRRTDRLADAKAEVEAAGKAVPADKRAQLLATCLEVVGERAEAEKYVVELVKQSPADPATLRAAATFYLGGGDLAKAKPYFEALIASADPAAAEARRWARRVFALALAGSGNYAQGTEALALLERNLTENPGNPEDVRTRALVLAVRPGGRRQSIRDLEESFAKIRPSPAEEFTLARLYEQDGDWPKASELMRGLLAGRGEANPDHTAYYVRALLRHNDVTTAVGWLTKLEAREKDPLSPRTVELRSRLLVKQERKAEAAALLKKYAQHAAAAKKDPSELARVGLLMAGLELTAEAEEVLRQYVSAARAKQPAAVLVLADFLARHDRGADALTICSEALADKVDPELVARQAVGVLRVTQPTPELAARAEAVVQKAIQARPQSADLQVSNAELRDAQARYDEAKKLYRDLIQQGSRNHLEIARNNLAWLLSLQEGNHAEALSEVNAAFKEFGPRANLLDTRGVIHMLAGDTTAAVADLTEAVAQAPAAVGYFHLAQAYQKAGNRLEAERAMRKARELELSKKDLHALEWPHFEPMMGLVGGK